MDELYALLGHDTPQQADQHIAELVEALPGQTHIYTQGLSSARNCSSASAVQQAAEQWQIPVKLLGAGRAMSLPKASRIGGGINSAL